MDHSEGSKGRVGGGGREGSDLVDQKNSRVTCILNQFKRQNFKCMFVKVTRHELIWASVMRHVKNLTLHDKNVNVDTKKLALRQLELCPLITFYKRIREQIWNP